MDLPSGGQAATRDEVLEDLFRLHHRRLVGLASLLVDDRGLAEDVVQEAFSGLHRKWTALRNPDRAVQYLNRAVVNAARDELRTRRRKRALHLVPVSEQTSSAEDEAVAHDSDAALWQAIRELPQRQREVLVHRYYLNLSEAEIADTLGISRGSVKTHASRGLSALSLQLGDQR